MHNPREPFLLTFKSYQQITPNVRHMVFEKHDGRSFDFTAGQFITFLLDVDGEEIRRSYSVAVSPDHLTNVEIAVSYVAGGSASDILFNLQPGDTLKTTGPFGRFCLQDTIPKRYLLIATGTGVTPYLSMLPELKERINQHGLEVVIVLGVQGQEHLLYGEQFNEFSEHHPSAQFMACYSRQFPDEPQPFEQEGHVQAAFAELNANPENDIVYLCGNPAMIDDAFSYFKELGFAVQQIRREKYISS